jgi:hypothetical protein
MTTMSIGGAKVALIDSSRNGMLVEAYPTRLAMVLAVLNNGAIGGIGGYGSDGHKAALNEVAERITIMLDVIAAREKRDAEIEAMRGPWIAAAAARYVEAGELDADEAKSAAASLFSLYANDGDGGLPDAAQAASEDMSTWG